MGGAFFFILLDIFNRWQRNERNILLQDRKWVRLSLKSGCSSWTNKSSTTSSASRTSRHMCRPRTLQINVPHEDSPLQFHFRWGNILWPLRKSGKLLLPTLWQDFLCLSNFRWTAFQLLQDCLTREFLFPYLQPKVFKYFTHPSSQFQNPKEAPVSTWMWRLSTPSCTLKKFGWNLFSYSLPLPQKLFGIHVVT